MVKSFAKSVGTKLFNALIDVVEIWKPSCLNDPNEWNKRTQGIKIKTLVDNDKHKISLWDLVGQKEYHAFHDMVIPNLSFQENVSYFLLLCNPFDQKTSNQKSMEMIKGELCYWLRFISSNTKRSINFQPHMSIMMTNANKKFTNMKIDEGDVKSLKNTFGAFINLSLKFYSINAHSSQGARKVVQDAIENCKTILCNLSDVYVASMDMQVALCEWNEIQPQGTYHYHGDLQK